MAKPPINYLVIPCAGSGSRMESEIPKQFIEINGKPVIVWTLEAFQSSLPHLTVLLPTSDYGMEWVAENIKHWPILRWCKAIEGGQTRFQSVKNALAYIRDDRGITLVHDAARPLVDLQTIQSAYDTAIEKDSAIPTVPLKDSIRHVENGSNSALDRSNYCLVQTPQAFYTKLIVDAYEHVPYSPAITDDASVIELFGREVHLSKGNYQNIKITTPEDLIIAKSLLG